MDVDKGTFDTDNLPLIRTLEASVALWKSGNSDDLVVTALTEKAGSAMSAPGIYAELKRFFRQAAKSAVAAGLDEQPIHKLRNDHAH